ncbi:M14-type cytosolic carboxypeptidase [Cognatishimia sp. WU-CL00825]|uniref:M14 family metallopeptidase n=1 Tax=Cognatishimia sp. WU-CL00825 TaxID=3127658 RepID=UPI003107142A
MRIDSGFDGGNIDVISCEDAGNITLHIRQDSCAAHAQWFYFRVLGAGGKDCRFSITNAKEASYPEAWPDGSVVMSHNQQDWFRVPTTYHDGRLGFCYSNPSDVLYVALSPPYSYARHQNLICRALASDLCQLQDCVATVENRSVEILKFGSARPEAPAVWIIARQHPGEPMAEWFMEGLIDQLLCHQDPLAQALRQNLRFYLVPNMNPDGSIAGNLRTNAAGVDLNRAWDSPSRVRSPEVSGVMSLMDRLGADMFLDIHGDEEFRFVFAAGCEGIPNFDAEMAASDGAFRRHFRQENPDFSLKNGYPADAPGTADLSIACNQIGHRFGCFSMTIEMPFKDNAERLDKIEGWGTQHSKALGEAVLFPIAKHFGVVENQT